MIFLKHFDANSQSLLGNTKIYVPRNSKVGDLQGTINQMMGWAPTTPLKLYEVRPGSSLLSDASFLSSRLTGFPFLCLSNDYRRSSPE